MGGHHQPGGLDPGLKPGFPSVTSTDHPADGVQIHGADPPEFFDHSLTHACQLGQPSDPGGNKAAVDKLDGLEEATIRNRRR